MTVRVHSWLGRRRPCHSEDRALSQSPQPKAPTRSAAELLDALVASGGTGAHPHVRSGALSSGPEAMRNLADAVHFLCLLPGRHPGVLDNAAPKAVDPASRPWMDDAAAAFAPDSASPSKTPPAGTLTASRWET